MGGFVSERACLRIECPTGTTSDAAVMLTFRLHNVAVSFSRYPLFSLTKLPLHTNLHTKQVFTSHTSLIKHFIDTPASSITCKISDAIGLSDLLLIQTHSGAVAIIEEGIGLGCHSVRSKCGIARRHGESWHRCNSASKNCTHPRRRHHCRNDRRRAVKDTVDSKCGISRSIDFSLLILVPCSGPVGIFARLPTIGVCILNSRPSPRAGAR
jgi:hypothetical protein